MKTKKLLSRIRGIASPALLSAALAACSSTPTTPPPEGTARMAYTKGVPGGVIVQTLTTTATVTAIDRAQRTATLRASDGKDFTVRAASDAARYDEIRVGEQVKATVTQKIVAHIEKANSAASDGAAPGTDQPAGPGAETVQLSGRISAINSVQRTVTLRFEDGNTHTLQIRDDVSVSRFKVGDQMSFRVTEATVIRFEKP